ncbi:MAG TPA: polyprenyl synthetase family protein, partial [Candidatus Anaerotruncus excrementipullorum]|nr:polyprenyl synthetase family protein [Candidatus Anaerotruncus excrementipullorum]
MENRYERQLAEYATSVNDALREQLRARGDCPQVVVLDAMRHSLLDAGKRIRGALVLEFGRLAGASREGAMACACAVEMVHAYSLIHDDLPCMD